MTHPADSSLNFQWFDVKCKKFQGFSSLVDETTLVKLGPVDKDWFDKATNKTNAYSSSHVPKKEDQWQSTPLSKRLTRPHGASCLSTPLSLREQSHVPNPEFESCDTPTTKGGLDLLSMGISPLLALCDTPTISGSTLPVRLLSTQTNDRSIQERDLAYSLGANVSNISWTSSLATPPLGKGQDSDEDKRPTLPESVETVRRDTAAVRNLFQTDNMNGTTDDTEEERAILQAASITSQRAKTEDSSLHNSPCVVEGRMSFMFESPPCGGRKKPPPKRKGRKRKLSMESDSFIDMLVTSEPVMLSDKESKTSCAKVDDKIKCNSQDFDMTCNSSSPDAKDSNLTADIASEVLNVKVSYDTTKGCKSTNYNNFARNEKTGVSPVSVLNTFSTSLQSNSEEMKNDVADVTPRPGSHSNTKCNESANKKSSNSILFRKKKFSYPSARQIKETCPTKLFTYADKTSDKNVVPSLVESTCKLDVRINSKKANSVDDDVVENEKKILGYQVTSETESTRSPSRQVIGNETIPCSKHGNNWDMALSEIDMVNNKSSITAGVKPLCENQRNQACDAELVKLHGARGEAELWSNISIDSTIDQSGNCDANSDKLSLFEGEKTGIQSNVSNLFENEKTSDETLVRGKEVSLNCPEYIVKDGQPGTSDLVDFVGFKSASGKTVKFSEKSLAKAKAMLDEGLLSNNEDGVGGFNLGISGKSLARAKTKLGETVQSTSEKFAGLKSASGTTINIFEELPDKVNAISDESVQPTCERKFVGFKSASGETVNVSEKSLAKAKAILNECEQSTNENNKLVGFKSANGKTVDVSEKSLAKSKEILNESVQSRNEFVGFKSASGKAINISEKSLSKSKALLDETVQPANEFVGFKSASGKAINISEKSLSKSKALLDETVQPANEFVGFKSASGKAINISEKSLSKSKALLDETVQPANEFVGFKSASGKAINISEKSLSKSKALLDEISMSNNNDVLGGFKSASGKDIKISSESLKKARSILEETHQTDLVNDDNIYFTADSSKSNLVSETATRAASKFPKQKSNSTSINDRPQGFRPFKAPRITSIKKIEPKTCEDIPKKPVVSRRELMVPEDVELSSKLDEDDSQFSPIGQLTKFTDTQLMEVSESTSALLGIGELSQWDVSSSSDDCKGATPNGNFSCGTNKAVNNCSFEQSINSSLSFQGFSTASGHVVNVSDKALLKARQLLNPECDLDVGIPDTDQFQTNVNMRGDGQIIFDTVSGNNVGVARQSLENVNQNDSNISKWSTRSSSVVPTLFQTASGNSVMVSKKSLDHAKQNLEIDEDDVSSVSTTFQSASGNSVKVSKEALDHVKQNCETDKKGVTSVSTMFQTASGNAVTVTQKALDFVKKNFESDDCSTNSVSTMFQTASGNGVMVSKEALKHVKHNFETDESNVSAVSIMFQTASGNGATVSNKALEHVKQNFETNEKDVSSVSTMFQTASGNGVTVSKKALEHVKQNFETDQKGISSVSTMFQTASGNGVSVSKKALEHVKQNFEKDVPYVSTLFQTASGNGVTVSKKALEHVKQNFETDEKDISFVSTMFQTASGNGVSVSKKALEHVKQNFETDEKDVPSVSTIFQTASGNGVTVSKKALEHVKQNFETNEKDVSSVSTMFQTASGNGVSVSKKALEHVKQNFETDEKDISSVSTMFQTASGNRVSVPKKALEDVKQNFEGDKGNVSPVATMFQTASGSDVKVSKLTLDLVKQNFPSEQVDEPMNDMDMNACKFVGKNCQKGTFGKTFCKNDCAFKEHHSDDEHCSETLVRNGRPVLNSRHSPNPCPMTTSPAGVWYDRSNMRSMISSPAGQQAKQNRASTHSPIPERSSFVPPLKRKFTAGSNDQERQCMPTVITDNSKDHNSSTFKPPYKPSISFKPPTKSTVQTKTVQTIEECSKRSRSDDMQNEIILRKKKGVVKVVPGSLWIKKMKGERVSMRSAVNDEIPRIYSPRQLHAFGVQPTVASVCSDDAESYVFSCQVSPSQTHMTIGDMAILVLNDSGTYGKEAFYKAFLTVPGVDPSLVSADWVYNHYRLIVWKLASMEKSFPKYFAGRCLTMDMLMFQLKYRYDCEVDQSLRSALKKILEKDDTPTKLMVLCVSSVIESQDAEELCLELTDGWYTIKATVDKPLKRLVHAGKISVGQKLCISGADFAGPHEACSPLQAPETLRLKLNGNSTRRARWDTKLGFCVAPTPMCLPLNSLFPDGGMVPCVDVVIARVYPIQFVERLPDGGSVFRCAQEEEKALQKYEEMKQKKIEKIYSRLQAEFEQKKRTNPCKRRKITMDLRELTCGEDIYAAVGDDGEDCLELSDDQLQMLNEYKQRLHNEERQAMETEFRKAMEEMKEQFADRRVVPQLRVRIAGCSNGDLDRSSHTILSVWKPSEDMSQALKEGKRLRLYNLMASLSRTPCSGSNAQLSTTKQTRYHELPIDDNFLDLIYECREVMSFTELKQQSFQPLYGEVDVVGVVVSKEEIQMGSSYQTVYLADGEEDLLVLKVWSFAQAGVYDTVLTPGVIVGASSLQWNGMMGNIPSVASSTLSCISQRPPHAHLKLALAKLKERVQKDPLFVSRVQEEVTDHLTKSCINHPRTPSSTSNCHLNNPGCSDQSSTPQTDRSSAIKRKIARLASYGPPPPLPPLSSPILKCKFKSPLPKPNR